MKSACGCGAEKEVQRTVVADFHVRVILGKDQVARRGRVPELRRDFLFAAVGQMGHHEIDGNQARSRSRARRRRNLRRWRRSLSGKLQNAKRQYHQQEEIP